MKTKSQIKRQLEKQLKIVVRQIDELKQQKLDILVAIFKLKGRCYLCEQELHTIDECHFYAGTCVGCNGQFQNVNPEAQRCLACDFDAAVTNG